MMDSWDRVKRWRWRAEEPRAVADEFLFVANRDGLYRMAETYDRLADDAEERLTNTGFMAGRDAG